MASSTDRMTAAQASKVARQHFGDHAWADARGRMKYIKRGRPDSLEIETLAAERTWSVAFRVAQAKARAIDKTYVEEIHGELACTHGATRGEHCLQCAAQDPAALLGLLTGMRAERH